MRPALLLPLIFLVAASARAGGVIDARMHHLRWGEGREWAEFPAKAEGAEYVVTFDARAGDAERTLRIRHRDLKQVWTVRLNGVEIGRLPQDENEMVTYRALPATSVRQGQNELRVTPPPALKGPLPAEGGSDDVMIGEAELIDAPRAQVLSGASVDVTVTDAGKGGGEAAALPCRITVADERGALVELANATDAHAAVRPGVVYTADGHARLSLAAGKYTIYAGHGFAYSVESCEVTLRPGDSLNKALRIRRVVPTDGYVCTDTHIHTFTYSRHGDATIDERMLTLAGEGVELPIATDHNLTVDYEPVAAKLGVRRYFTPVIGDEVTTASLGHFNVFPLARDSRLIDWRLPSWARLSRDIAEKARGTPGAAGPVVILNHARDSHGGFRPFDPARHVSCTGEDVDGWELPANAMEVINSGATLTDPMLLVHDWFGLMNRGRFLTPVGASDSHDVSRYIVGQGRTYVRCPSTDPGKIDVRAALEQFRAGRVLVSYGLLTDIRVAGKYGPGDLVPAAALRGAGAPGGNGEEDHLKVHVRVLGPEWTRASRVMLFANGVEVKRQDLDSPAAGTPEPAGVKWETTWSLPRPNHDLWLVAVAIGPGVQKPFWPTAKPYQPASPEWRSYVLGVTGAVRVDADASGTFDSPYEYASRIVTGANGDVAKVIAALDGYELATAEQAASLLRARNPQSFAKEVSRATGGAAPQVKEGFETFLRESSQTKARNP
jgi:hypothetical protein